MGSDADTGAASRLERHAPIALLVAAMCLVAANMRPTITGVGPLLEQIAADLDTTPVALGALASVPLLTWALISPLAHDLSRRFGMSRVVLWALLALTVGTVWRSLTGPIVNLWLGTALVGAALAIANVLMPAVVKRDFPRHIARMMAVYTALLSGVGAVASGVVVPISHIEVGGQPVGWQVALLATGILLPPAIVAWIWAMVRSAPEHGFRHARGARRRTGIWTDAVAWQVAGYMGLQSASFYIHLTWLASFATSHGRSEVAAGLDVMIYQIFAFVSSALLPFALRGRLRRWIPALIPLLAIVEVIGLLLAPELLTFWVCLGGLAAGSSLGMSLTLMAERARDHTASSALSGMSQSVGYLIAALGPVLFGGLLALTGGWVAPFALLLAVLAGQGVVGLLVRRDRLVLEPR